MVTLFNNAFWENLQISEIRLESETIKRTHKAIQEEENFKYNYAVYITLTFASDNRRKVSFEAPVYRMKRRLHASGITRFCVPTKYER